MSKPKKGKGRPTKLTKAVLKKVAEFAVLGIPNQKVFATLIGVDVTSVIRWMAKGKERREILTIKEKKNDNFCQFYHLIEIGKARAYAKAVQVWLKHIATHENIGAVTKYLAIMDAANWSEIRKEEIAHSGEIKSGYTIEELHELAKKAVEENKKEV